MELTEEQKEILSDYTDNLDEVMTFPYYDYTHASGKEVSKMLDEYHILWFHTDPGNMYLVKRKDSS